jgi:hypothetical protein
MHCNRKDTKKPMRLHGLFLLDHKNQWCDKSG